MPEVLLGESRVYITDQLRRELGWSRGCSIVTRSPGAVEGLYQVKDLERHHPNASRPLRQRGTEWYFDMKIPGVSRGRLNGSRTCKYSVENGTLVLDVRDLLK